MINKDYLKELRIWLCADLRNTNGELICECGKEDKEVIEVINNIQIQLEEINNNLEILKQCIITHNNTHNNIHNKTNNKCCKGENDD